MSDTIKHIVELANVIELGAADVISWEKERSKYDKALVGERIIVIDNYDRTFRQGNGQYELKMSAHDLIGVSHLTSETAKKVVQSLSESHPDAAPYTAIDFQDFADIRVREARDLIVFATQAKDLLTAPYMNEARFKEWSRKASFLLEEGRGNGEEQSSAYKHALKVIESAPFVKQGDGNIIAKEGVAVVYGPLLDSKYEDALTVFRIKHGDDWQEQLSAQWQRSEYPGMSAAHTAALQQLRNSYGPEWLSQIEERASPESHNFLIVEINNTANAAFVDSGREQEIGRIVASAADILTEHGVQGLDKLLFDTNGNSVGVVRSTDQPPVGLPEAGSVRLVLDFGNSESSSDHIATIVRDAAVKLALGKREFPLQDINGNSLGQAQRTDDLSRVVDGKVNLESELRSGNVYKADDGFSGIADGEYRYVVADYEVGYGRNEGPVILVSAQGEVAPGYEGGTVISENLFSKLPSEERESLIAVAAGVSSIEEHERRFSGDESELDLG